MSGSGHFFLDGFLSSKKREEEIQATIHNACQALINKDVDTFLSYCTDNVSLVWGPFSFERTDGVKQWAKELGQMFPKLVLWKRDS